MLQTPPLKLCKIQKVQQKENEILFNTENGNIAVTAAAENILRIRYTKKEKFLKIFSIFFLFFFIYFFQIFYFIFYIFFL